MTSRAKREWLKVHILETERLVEQVQDHPTMGFQFRQRLTLLREELKEIPADTKEPTVSLLFSGGPVAGSEGIDAGFIAKVILPFQKLVQADLAQRGGGKVGSRGQIKMAAKGKLFLTALPKGSFGVELTKLEENNLFDEAQVSDSLSHVAKLIDSSARSDEDFAASLDGISSRAINGLRQFLHAIADNKAGITIESGGIRSSLSIGDVQHAYDRVSTATTKVIEIKVIGLLKGILLESWKFDFVSNEGKTFSGALSNELTEEQAAEITLSFFNKSGTALIEQTSVYLKNGRIKDSFILLSIN